jgi:hypothetical protein
VAGGLGGDVTDLTREEAASRKALYGFGTGPYRKPEPRPRTSAQERLRRRRLAHAAKVEARRLETLKRHEYELSVVAERNAEDKKRAYMRLLDEAIARANGERL